MASLGCRTSMAVTRPQHPPSACLRRLLEPVRRVGDSAVRDARGRRSTGASETDADALRPAARRAEFLAARCVADGRGPTCREVGVEMGVRIAGRDEAGVEVGVAGRTRAGVGVEDAAWPSGAPVSLVQAAGRYMSLIHIVRV